MVSVIKMIKQEIQFEESLKQRLEFICEFSKVTTKNTNKKWQKNLPFFAVRLFCIKFIHIGYRTLRNI